MRQLTPAPPSPHNLRRFSQAAGAATKAEFGGNGLGLVLSRDICHALGGDLTLASEGQGLGCRAVATFRLEAVQRRPGGGPQAPRQSTSNGLARVEIAVKRTSEAVGSAIVRAASQFQSGIASSFRAGGAPAPSPASAGGAWSLHSRSSSAASVAARSSLGARGSVGLNGGLLASGRASTFANPRTPGSLGAYPGYAEVSLAALAGAGPEGATLKRGSADTWDLPRRNDLLGLPPAPRRNTIHVDSDKAGPASRLVAELQTSSSTMSVWDLGAMHAPPHASPSGAGGAPPHGSVALATAASGRAPLGSGRDRGHVAFAAPASSLRRESRDGSSGPWPALDAGSAAVAAAAAASAQQPASSLRKSGREAGSHSQSSAGLFGAVINGIAQAMQGLSESNRGASRRASGRGGGGGEAGAGSAHRGGGGAGSAPPPHVAVSIPKNAVAPHDGGGAAPAGDASAAAPPDRTASGMTPTSGGAATLSSLPEITSTATISASTELRITPAPTAKRRDMARRMSLAAREERRVIAEAEEEGEVDEDSPFPKPPPQRRLLHHKSTPHTRRERAVSFDDEDEPEDPGEDWVCTMRVVAAEDDMLWCEERKARSPLRTFFRRHQFGMLRLRCRADSTQRAAPQPQDALADAQAVRVPRRRRGGERRRGLEARRGGPGARGAGGSRLEHGRRRPRCGALLARRRAAALSIFAAFARVFSRGGSVGRELLS